MAFYGSMKIDHSHYTGSIFSYDRLAGIHMFEGGAPYIFLLCIIPFILHPAVIRAETSMTLSSLPSVNVRGFRLVGNTIFSEEELSVIISPYINREITAEELQILRRTLTEYYIQNGYVS